jgi:hypothetical protein
MQEQSDPFAWEMQTPLALHHIRNYHFTITLRLQLHVAGRKLFHEIVVQENL